MPDRYTPIVVFQMASHMGPSIHVSDQCCPNSNRPYHCVWNIVLHRSLYTYYTGHPITTIDRIEDHIWCVNIYVNVAILIILFIRSEYFVLHNKKKLRVFHRCYRPTDWWWVLRCCVFKTLRVFVSHSCCCWCCWCWLFVAVCRCCYYTLL